ncbi:hypothetical protein EKE94_11780 [Mesobaculum littorinae]|uniref:Acyl-CoA dehydrogenase/oxidase C-terminal domain-containing protein n=1 Tax=Mesobaculum littorinae TaxID=2486419 RepID=A0A438AHM8_9RHOB|nr:acyl-CoA dehydrogenase family protein [Mesobaculum littorinae]RVV98125.1 hypothetical protein EKE94_11780 [Mesobaculum littorinae]
MDFEISEEDRMLADLAERLFPPQGTSADAATVAEAGLYALTVPEDAGGFGGGLLSVWHVARAAGRGLAGVPLTQTAILPGALLAASGQDTLAQGLAAGEARVAACLDPGLTVAGGRVSGQLSDIVGAEGADWLIAPADGPEGRQLLLLPLGGADVTPAPLFDGTPAARIAMDMDLPGDAVLAGGNAAEDALTLARRLLWLAVAAETAGAAEAAVAETAAYLPDRKQFGQRLADFQALRHRLVDMMIAAQEIHAMSLHAAMALGAGAVDADVVLEAALLKAALAGRRVGQEAVQLHGGVGVTQEYRISRVFQRLTRLGLAAGGVSGLTQRLAGREARLLG